MRTNAFNSSVFAVFLVLAAGCGSKSKGSPDAGIPEVNCVAETPSAEAMRPTGPHPEGGWILPGARLVRPAGSLVPLFGFPLNLLPLPDGRHIVVTGTGHRSHTLWLVDLVAEEILDEVEERDLFYGLAVSSDATRLYAGGGEDGPVYVYDLDLNAGLIVPVDVIDTDVWAGAVALTPDASELYVLDNDGRNLAIVDVATHQQVENMPIGRKPYDIVMDGPRGVAYISMWESGEVVVFDLEARVVEDAIPVGKNPQALVMSADRNRLFVVNTDSDTLSVIDLQSREVDVEVEVGPITDLPRGVSPSHIALTPDGQRLLITSAGVNAVEVYDAVTLESVGAIPAGFYPSAVALNAAGDEVYILNAKGVGTGPGFSGGVVDYMWGNLQITDMPDAAGLAAGAQQAVSDYQRPLAVSPGLDCSGDPPVFPVPMEQGGLTPIRHVMLIIRENKTYDVQLGDLETGDGEPDLALWDEWYTPNLHALARRFVNLDNFYTNGEISTQGHYWLTAGMVNDFTERASPDGAGYRSPAGFSTNVVGFPEGPFLWGHLRAWEVDYVNYGQVVGIVVDGDEGWDLNFPTPAWNMDVLDKHKAEYVADRILIEGFMPTFTYLLLTNNHTYGTSPGKPTPASMVADNDEGTGIVIEALSHSPFWETSVVFIVEDDPQQGGDHVDMHRSLCLVVSPWAKRGYTSSVHHDIPSLWRTIALMVGMGPLSVHDANAAPMYDAFGSTLDSTPYEHIPRNVPEEINPENAPFAAESSRMDFSKPDQARGLSRLLWRVYKGVEPPWPAAPQWPDRD